MEGKIRYEDLFEGDIFEKVKASALELLKILESLEIGFKSLAKINIDTIKSLSQEPATAKNFEKISKATTDLANNLNQISKIQRQRAAIEEKLTKDGLNELKLLQERKYQLREVMRDYRKLSESEDAARRSAELLEKVNKDLFNSYHEMSEALEKLRIRYKDLVASGKGNTEEAIKLKNAIGQLDAKVKEIDFSVGQYTRNVGNYLGDMRTFWAGLKEEAMSANGIMGKIIQTGYAMREAFIAAGGSIKGLTASIRVLSRAVFASGILALLNFAGSLLGSIWDKITGRRESEEEISEEEIMNMEKEVRDAEALLDYQKKINQIEKQLEDLRIKGLEYTEEYKNLLEEQFALKKAMLKQRIDFLQENVNLLNTTNLLNDKIEENQKENDDFGKQALKSLQEEASLKSDMVQQNKVVSALQAENKDLTKARLEDQKELLSLLSQYNDLVKEEGIALMNWEAGRKKMLEQYLNEIGNIEEKYNLEITKILKERDEQLQSVRDLYEKAKQIAFTTDEIKLIEAEYNKRILDIQVSTTEKIVNLVNEIFNKWQEIDFSINEDILNKNLLEIENQYKSYREAIEKGIKELEEIRVKGEIEIDEETKKMIKLDEIEERIKAEQAKLLELEKIKNKKIINAKIEYYNNLIERQKQYEISTIILEKNNFKDIEEFNKYKQKRIYEIELNGYNERLKIYESYIEELKKQDTDTEDLELALNVLKAKMLETEMQYQSFLKQIGEGTKTFEEKMAESLKILGDNLVKSSELLEAILERINKKQENLLNHQIEANKRRMDLLIASYQRGSDNALGSIAELEKRESELIRQQEKIKRQAQLREMALSALRSYSSQLQQGINPQQALLNVIKDLTTITSMVRSLPTYYHGTEYIKTSNLLANTIRDNLIVRVHQGERIVPAYINRYLNGIKNEDLPKLIQSEKITFEYDTFLNSLSLLISKGNQKNKITKLL